MKILQLMSKELNLDTDYITKLSKNNSSYKMYVIPKKHGSRIIYHPSKDLKLLQYWLVNRIFKKFPISKYSTAYSKGNSIKKNALMHKNSNYILHLDIEHFFESITSYHIDKLLNKINNLDDNDKTLIKDIILFNGKYLVIGSVASPIVANCVMYDIDLKIFNNCIKNTDLIYTRYADDIIISSKSYINKEIINEISSILQDNNLKLNTKKTYFMNKKGKRYVTGITIDNNTNKLSLGHKQYRTIKNMIYNFLVKQIGNKDQILGYLSFIKDIDENKYNSLRSTYLKYDKSNSLFL